jgi:phosphatidylinositol 4-kinase A
LAESYNQQFRASPFLHEIKPSPWEALTHDLTKGLLVLSLNDASVREQATSAIVAYLNNCARAVKGIIKSGNEQNGLEGAVEPVDILITALSLAGFLEGASHSTQLWTAAEKSAIIERLQNILSDDFLVAVETAASKIRNSSATDFTVRDWRRYNRRYAAKRRPLGAMLLQQRFSRFIKSCIITTTLRRAPPSNAMFFEKYADELVTAEAFTESEEAALVKHIVGIITDEIHLLEDGADYLQIGAQWQQELAFSVKASSLIAFLNCMSVNEELADTDLLLSWLEDTLADANQMAAFDLATTALKVIAITAKMFPANASSLSHLLLKFIIQGGASQPILSVAASCLAKVLKVLSPDFVITTLYSLGNVLSPTVGGAERPAQLPAETLENNATLDSYNSNAESVVSLSYTGEDDSTVTHRNVVHAIVIIAVSCEDEKIAALAQSMLLQKIGRISLVADAYIIQETAALASVSKHTEFQLLVKFYARLHRDALLRGHSIIADAVHNARNHLAVILRESPSHRGIYLVHLLEGIISKGDVSDLGRDKQKDIALSPDDITPLLKPLALLLSDSHGREGEPTEPYQYDEDTAALFRDAWFNIAVHGISVQSDVGRRYRNELCIIAERSPPLVPENRTEILESDVELNITLRRGMGHHRMAEQRKLLANELPDQESNIKRINYQETIFLNASLLVESLRASAGDCTKILLYFLDPSLSSSELGKCMEAVADKVIDIYLSSTLSSKGEHSASPHLSKQLAEIFVYCCHRINRVQEVALNCASKIIGRSPSVLCERNPLFVLLDLLTIMWSSCLENELDEYGWKPTCSKGNVTVELSDNHESRKRALGLFHSRAKAWMIIAINLAPLDVKGLLQVNHSCDVEG